VSEPRETNLDGHRHIEGGSCCEYRLCRRCKSGRLHVQFFADTNPGCITLESACEGCVDHRERWQPNGTYAALSVS